MKTYWLSSQRMTVLVRTNDAESVVDAAPIVRKFIGQPLTNLVRWMSGQGGFRQERLS